MTMPSKSAKITVSPRWWNTRGRGPNLLRGLSMHTLPYAVFTKVEDNRIVRHFRAEISAASSVKCYWCGKTVPKRQRTVDHIVPVCRGGSDDATNLCCACRHCNTIKGQKLPEEFQGQYVLEFPKARRAIPTDAQPPSFPPGSVLTPQDVAGMRLTPREKEIFRERFVNRRSLREIAQMLCVQVDSVKCSAKRLRRKVRRAL